MNIDPSKIIIKPIITEKSIIQRDTSKYVIAVSIEANKDQVKEAFKILFGVTPKSVNMLTVKGKTKTNWKKRTKITKKSWKKAIISVDSKAKIELLSIKQK